MDQAAVEGIMGQYGWVFAAAFVVMIFRRTIESMVDALMIFLGKDYDVDDVVLLDGKPGRIVRVGM